MTESTTPADHEHAEDDIRQHTEDAAEDAAEGSDADPGPSGDVPREHTQDPAEG
jgi:hypothetical protein